KLLLGNRPVVSFGSGGEFRSAVLAWRLAESEWLAASTGASPIVLLDDVFSELDRHRRTALLEGLPARQPIITTPGAEDAAELLGSAARLIELSAPDRVTEPVPETDV